MDSPTPPPPPPQLSPDDTAKSSAREVEAEPEPADEVPAEVLADVDTSRPGLRVTGAIAGAFVGALVSVGSGVVAGVAVSALAGTPYGQLYGTISALTVGALSFVFLNAALVYFGEHLAGGQGTFLAALAGSAAGTVVGGGLVVLGVVLLSTGHSQVGAGTVAIVVGSSVTLFGPVLSLERSHTVHFAKAVPSVGFMPMKNGGLFALGWSL